MKKQTFGILALFGATCSAFATLTTNSATGTIDTRDYVVTITSPMGDIDPTSGTTVTRSWHSSISSFVYEPVLFEQNGTIMRHCSGFAGNGISPASGSGDSAVITLTNVTSTLVWQWNTSYWVTWATSGQGRVLGTYPDTGGWYNDGQSYLLRAHPDYGWRIPMETTSATNLSLITAAILP